ncbi:hypothetical protein [Thalassotalea montiporae]
MKRLYTAVLLTAVLSGCDTANLHLTEQQYEDALDNGDIVTQLTLLDELYQHAPEVYAQDYEDKQALGAVIEQLMANPKNFAGISDEQLSLVIDFAPSYQPFSYAAMHLAEKQRIKGNIQNAQNKVALLKKGLLEKLKKTPSHIEAYETQITLKGIAPYFLQSQYARNLLGSYRTEILNSYQLNAIVNGLSNVHSINQEQIRLHRFLVKLTPEKVEALSASINQEQADIQRILVWLYKQQVEQGIATASQSNDYLLSLLNNRYGRQRLDSLWLNVVEPKAKKAVMTAKETYLSDLDLIATKIYRVAGDNNQLKALYKQTLELDAKLLSLMWPPNGLINFKESSIKAKAELAASFSVIQQL